MTVPVVPDLVQPFVLVVPRPPIALGDSAMRELQDHRARTLLCAAARRRGAFVRYSADDIRVTYDDHVTTAEWHPDPTAPVKHYGGPLDRQSATIGERILSESGGRAPELYETPNGRRIPGESRSDWRTTIYRRAGIDPATGRWVYVAEGEA